MFKLTCHNGVLLNEDDTVENHNKSYILPRCPKNNMDSIFFIYFKISIHINIKGKPGKW